jgi:hypothetical protein
LRERLKDGFRFFEIDGRMRGVEAALGTLVGAAIQRASTISEQTVVERIAQARQVVQLQERPTMYLAAWPSEPTEFSTLFDSRNTSVVQLLDNPQRLRHSGFDVNTDQPSVIVQAQLRRSTNIRPKLLELWRDGILISVTPGDEWHLCWGMNSKAPSALTINNLALAETTYSFSSLALKLFEHSVPRSSKLNLCLGLTNMTTEGGPCSLSSHRLSRYFPEKGTVAPGDDAKIRREVEMASSDAGTVSYGLLADLYAWFGFEADQMPYVNPDTVPPRIDATQLVSQTG